MPDVKLTAIDNNALLWEERPNERIGGSLYRKNLIEDPDTGLEIRLVRYPAGVVNPLHTHPLVVAARRFASLSFEGFWTLRSSRPDLSFRLESATGRSGAYPDGTFQPQEQRVFQDAPKVVF